VFDAQFSASQDACRAHGHDQWPAIVSNAKCARFSSRGSGDSPQSPANAAPQVGHSLHMLPPLPPAQLVTIPEHSPFTHPSVPFLFCPSPFLSPPSPFLTPHEDTPMLTCSGCRVARFCSAGHRKIAPAKVALGGSPTTGVSISELTWRKFQKLLTQRRACCPGLPRAGACTLESSLRCLRTSDRLVLRGVCVYYCRTYYKAVRGGGDGTLEEPGTITQGAPVFPGSSRLGIEPKTPGWLVQDPTTRPIGDLGC